MTTSVPGVVAGVDERDKITSVAQLREMMRIRELEQRSLDLSTATPRNRGSEFQSIGRRSTSSRAPRCHSGEELTKTGHRCWIRILAPA
jgi:predicted Zn-ribbon and HTH transcriptional regulator